MEEDFKCILPDEDENGEEPERKSRCPENRWECPYFCCDPDDPSTW